MVGLAVVLLATAQVAVSIRAMTNTEMLDSPPVKPQAPFARVYYVAWGEGLSFWKHPLLFRDAGLLSGWWCSSSHLGWLQASGLC